MRFTLFRYIFRNICSIFSVSLLVLIFIMMLGQMMWIADLMVNSEVRIDQVFKFLLYIMPRSIVFALPVACLMGVMLTFLRLSADNETIALNSSGISLFQMLPPVFFFSLIAYIITNVITVFAVPQGNESYRQLRYQILGSMSDLSADWISKERVFNEPVEDVIFYVNSFSSNDGVMRDLFVVNKQDPDHVLTIIAKEGRLLSDSRSKIMTIRFVDGTIFTVARDFASSSTLKFETYDYKIDLKYAISEWESKEKEPDEMFINEIIHVMQTVPKESRAYHQMQIMLLEMFSLPVAVFLMSILGAPLGTQIKLRGRSSGIAISLIIFILYNVLLAGQRHISESGIVPPSIGVWVPDCFLFCVAIYLLWRVGNDRPINIFKAF